MTTRKCPFCKNEVDVDVVHRCGSPRASWNVVNGQTFCSEVRTALFRWWPLTGRERATTRLILAEDSQRWHLGRWMGAGLAGNVVDELVAQSAGGEAPAPRGRAYNCGAAVRRALGLRVPRSPGAYRASVDDLAELLDAMASCGHLARGLINAPLALYDDVNVDADVVPDNQRIVLSQQLAEVLGELQHGELRTSAKRGVLAMCLVIIANGGADDEIVREAVELLAGSGESPQTREAARAVLDGLGGAP